MAEDFGVEDRGHFYDPVGAFATSSSTTLMQVVAARAMDAPARGGPGRSRTPSSPCSRRCATPTRLTTFAGSTTGTLDRRGCRRLDDRDLRRPPARDRELALGRRAVLHPDREAPARHSDRGAARVQATAELGFPHAREPGAEPTRDQARPLHRDQLLTRGSAGRRPGRSRSSSTWSSRSRAERAPRRTRCCCTRRWWATAARFTRQDGVEEAWRVLQPLLDAPPPVHPYAPGSWGPPRPRTSWWPAKDAGRTLGGVVTAPPTEERAVQSAAMPSPFPPIAEYAFLSIAIRARWSQPTARSNGSACRPSTHRASSEPARPRGRGSSGSGRSRSTPGRPLVRAGHEHAHHDVAHAQRMGGRTRCVDDGAPRPGGRGHAAHAAAGRRRRRPSARAGRAASRVELEIELVCEPIFNYGRARLMDDGGRRPAHRGAQVGGATVRLRTDMALGIEGNRVRARHVLQAGEQAFCVLSWAEGLTRRPTPARPCPARQRRPASGGPGSAARGSPTTGGARRSSDRRSR